jgi:menaquinone-dependent protoporphyrinogen IX oxidase
MHFHLNENVSDKRREWVKILSVALIVVLIGGLFIFVAPAEVKKSVVIVYGSRYGSTAQTAAWIAEGMEGRAAVLPAKEAGDLSGYEKVILGSGIYNDQLHADMSAFLEKHGEEVAKKLLALFVVCGTPADQAGGYLEMFAGKCQAKPLLARAFGGWQKKELLSPEDLKGLEDYYKSINVPFENYNHTDKAKCLEFAKEILAKMGAGK